jgi:DNA-binding CsgD family transcriptional regulator
VTQRSSGGRNGDVSTVRAAVRAAADGSAPQSGAALFTFGADQRIESWNAAAERLTGIPAEEIVGRSCWEALCAHDDAGDLICHTGCSYHRLLVESWPVAPPTLVVRTTSGPRRMRVPMIALEPRRLFAAVLLEIDEAPPPSRQPSGDGRTYSLTPRQREVLGMLAEGKSARVIAVELRLSEMTVRNHIRSILRELGCSSQLAAVAAARRAGLV